MRKEILGIFLVFLIILTFFSLLSFSTSDPSIHHVKGAGQIGNTFGLLGAHLSGFLMGLFGLGSFWIPILLTLSTIQVFNDNPKREILSTIGGGLLLVITTGSLLALRHNHWTFFGEHFYTGGGVGFALRDFLNRYTGTIGGSIILFVFFLVGLILATRFSVINFCKFVWARVIVLSERTKSFHVLWKARREKIKKKPKPATKKAKKKEPQIKIKIPDPKPVKKMPSYKQEVFKFMKNDSDFELPSVKFLTEPEKRPDTIDDENLKMQSLLLEKKLEDFGVAGKVDAISPGPVVTTFEYKPAPGVKINKIVNLSDDLALALRALSIRIVAPIPGKAVIGIEIPNTIRESVALKDIVVSNEFEKSKSKLTLCLGKDIVGNPVVAELDKMPHLLVAGATGAGKSVGLNAMITSLLYKSTPDDVKLIMIDPKRIELSIYDGIPHLITPVVTNMKKATNALQWSVKEMEKRYVLLSQKKARNITQYNKKIEKLKKEQQNPEDKELQKLPYIVIIIDELADLMMVSSRDVETALTRLAQMARAAGMHIVLATQRPSVDVLTGIIKANFPTRISFQVSSRVDSRTIIDSNGAESLLGDGDMLFLPPGTAKLQRIHGAYISEEEISKIIGFLKEQKKPEYDENVIKHVAQEEKSLEKEDYDEKYDEAIALVTKTKQASISMIQRHLRVGYNRAARIIEIMEIEGIVGPSDGVKAREVLVRGYDDMP